MQYNSSLSSAWSIDSNLEDSIFGSAVKSSRFSTLSTPEFKDSTPNINSNQFIETPPTAINEITSSKSEVSIGEKQVDSFKSSSGLQNEKKNPPVFETPKRRDLRQDTFQTPKEPKGIGFPSPSPSNKTFSLNLLKTPNNKKNPYSSSVFSTPRVVSGKMASPCSRQTIEAIQKVLNPDIIHSWRKITTDQFENNQKEDHQSNTNDIKIINNEDLIKNDHESYSKKNDDFVHTANDTNSDTNDSNNIINDDNQLDENNFLEKDSSEFITNDINISQYFSTKSTPSKFFRSPRFDPSLIDAQNEEDASFYDLIGIKNIPYYQINNKTIIEKKNQSEISKNFISNPTKVEMNTDSNTKYSKYENDLDGANVKKHKFRIVEDNQKESQNILTPESVKVFVPMHFQQTKHSSQNELPNQQESKSEISIQNQSENIIKFQSPASSRPEKIYTSPDSLKNQNLNNANNNTIFSSTSQTSKVFIPEKLSNDSPEVGHNLQKSIETKEIPPSSLQISNKTQENQPETYIEKQTEKPIHFQSPPSNSSQTISTPPNSVNLKFRIIEEKSNQENDIKPHYIPIPQTDKVFVPRNPKQSDGAPQIKHDINNQKGEEVTNTSTTEAQLSSNQPFSKSPLTSPNSRIRGYRMKDDVYSKIMKEEEERRIKELDDKFKAPRSPKTQKSKTILPNHQLECIAKKKSYRYYVDEGEITILTNGKEFIIKKSGVFDLIKGKKVILENKSNMPAVISKSSRT